jgi:cell division protein FtsB
MGLPDLRKKVTRRLLNRLAEHERGFRRKTIRLYLFCAGDYGLFRIYRLTCQREALKNEYISIVAEAVDCSYRLRRFGTDPHFVEWLARTKYGFSRPNETIYHLKLPSR